jgi:hypothetical protein
LLNCCPRIPSQGEKGEKVKNRKETPRRRISVTSSLNEISTEQLGTRADMRG